MFINKKNLIKAAMDGNPFRGMPGNINTANAQLSVIEGLLDSYAARGVAADLTAAIKYLQAATDSIFEQRATSAGDAAVATGVSLDNATAEVVEYGVAGTAVHGLVTFTGSARQVFRVMSTDASLKWQHPFADLASGEEYTVFEFSTVGGVTTVRIQQPVNGPVLVVYARPSAVSLPEGVEVTTWSAFTQVKSIDTWTHTGLIEQVDRVLNKASYLSGDPQWSDIPSQLYNQLQDDIDELSQVHWFARTWADAPLVAAGQSAITDRIPEPEFAVDKTGALVISAPTQTSGTHAGARAEIKPFVFAAETIIRVNVWANVEVDAQIRVYDGNGAWYFATLTVGTDENSTQDIPATAFSLSGVPGETVPDGLQVAAEIRITSPGYFLAYIGSVYIVDPQAELNGLPYQQRIRNGQSTWQGPIVLADQPVVMFRQYELTEATPMDDLLRQSLDEFSFKPVYYPDRPDAVTYGTAGTYGYRAPTTYNNNGDQQYKILQTLTTQDVHSLAISTQVSAMYNWLMDPATWHPMWPAFLSSWDDSIMRAAVLDPAAQTVTTYPPYGPPTDFYLNQTPSIEYPDPSMAAQILSVVIDIDQLGRQNGGNTYAMQTRAMLHKVIALFDVLYIETGTMAGTFSPNPSEQVWYGAWHGEITSAIAKAHRWAQNDIMAMPMLVERCEKWLNGLNAFLLRQTEQDDVFMAPLPWLVEPNWRSQYVETYVFSTKIATSRSGKEQRIATRVKPRRRMSYTSTEYNKAAADSVALLQAYQNRPIMFPEWRLATATGVDLPAGVETITLATPPADELTVGSRMLIKDGDVAETVIVSYRAGNTLYLATPLQKSYGQYAEVVPISLGAMFASQIISRATPTTSARPVGYDVLPQYDAISLPVLQPAQTFEKGENLEIVTRANNWRTAVDVGSDWVFDSISKDDGPILFYTGEDTSRITISRTWTLFNREEITAALGFINRTNGTQKPFWWPTLMRDLTLAGDQAGGDVLNVLTGPLTSAGTLLADYAAIAVVLPDGSVTPAGVTAVNELTGGVTALQLDRSLFVGETIKQSAMVCMVLRVRMTGDVVAVNYITPDKAEIKLNMTTVQAA